MKIVFNDNAIENLKNSIDLNPVADKIVDKSKGYAPVDSGNLRDSIKKFNEGIRLFVGGFTSYAFFVEMGTRKMAAQSYLRKALYNL
jgi:HK97 gp10 family phage protein